MRLRAAAIRQLDQSHFVAQNGLVTTSRLEEPSYAFAADTITFEDIQQPAIDPLTGAPLVDPSTGQPVVDHQHAGRKPEQLRLRRRRAGLLLADARDRPREAELLHRQRPHPQRLDLRLPGAVGARRLPTLRHGARRRASSGTSTSTTQRARPRLRHRRRIRPRLRSSTSSAPPPAALDAWVINDDGHDNLGLGRRDIVPEEEFRGRVFWNHRQHLVGGLLDDWTVQGEVGWISDRTFLEQYYENEWDENKDQLTGVRLKRTYDNQSFSLEANGRVNDFFTQTQWLPRLDHYWLGQPLFDDQLTWFEHSPAAYADIGIASHADEPARSPISSSGCRGKTTRAGSPISGEGERFITRQELDYPLDLAPFKVVPFALGELAHWGEDINGDDIQRAYVHTGVRASIPFWAVDPTIRDPLFNLNGLAHKVVFDAEASYADATRDLDQFPLYDELDDDSIEEFRRRLFFSPFGGELRRHVLHPRRAVVHRSPSSTRGSTPSAPACRAGSPRRRPKSPTT